MGFDEELVTDAQREACAVEVMRAILEDWCDDAGASFDETLDVFASRQWAEGPDNLRFVWERERKTAS